MEENNEENKFEEINNQKNNEVDLSL